jgi:hypothetical protein
MFHLFTPELRHIVQEVFLLTESLSLEEVHSSIDLTSIILLLKQMCSYLLVLTTSTVNVKTQLLRLNFQFQ